MQYRIIFILFCLAVILTGCSTDYAAMTSGLPGKEGPTGPKGDAGLSPTVRLLELQDENYHVVVQDDVLVRRVNNKVYVYRYNSGGNLQVVVKPREGHVYWFSSKLQLSVEDYTVYVVEFKEQGDE